MTAQEAIARVTAGGDLSREDAAAVMRQVMSGEVPPALMAGLLVGLRMKGETVDEITGFAQAMRACATRIECRSAPLVDTCGTGGDGSGTFNISTAASFVVAGAGTRVAKHGNRAASSHCGSADVLEALGVNIEAPPETVARCIDEVGLGFLFARNLHPAMGHAAGVRRELGVRTVFNILGPLSNPAGATRQVLGVFDGALVPTMARVALALGAERAYVVHGLCGLDELSTLGPSQVAEVRDGAISTYEVAPEDFRLTRASAADLAGGDPERNAEVLRSVLEGARGPCRDIVVLNAAAAIASGGLADDIAAGIPLAQESIDTGGALNKLEALKELSHRGSR
jgi:anthranilate phosphoribosyltransferase